MWVNNVDMSTSSVGQLTTPTRSLSTMKLSNAAMKAAKKAATKEANRTTTAWNAGYTSVMLETDSKTVLDLVTGDQHLHP